VLPKKERKSGGSRVGEQVSADNDHLQPMALDMAHAGLTGMSGNRLSPSPGDEQHAVFLPAPRTPDTAS
jgi:hypothetical protein